MFAWSTIINITFRIKLSAKLSIERLTHTQIWLTTRTKNITHGEIFPRTIHANSPPINASLCLVSVCPAHGVISHFVSSPYSKLQRSWRIASLLVHLPLLPVLSPVLWIPLPSIPSLLSFADNHSWRELYWTPKATRASPLCNHQAGELYMCIRLLSKLCLLDGAYAL